MLLPSIHKASRRDRAFTLTEILIAVGIIAVLTGILLPVMSSASESGRATKCVARMKALGIAITLYRNDHDGALPPEFPTAGGDVTQIWVAQIRPYVGINDTTRNAGAVAGMAPLVTCPTVAKSQIPVSWWETNYAVGLPFGTDGVPKKFLPDRASKTMMLTECVGKLSGFTSSVNASKIDFRHRGHANTIFFDGHADQLVEAQIPTDINDVFWSGR